MELRAVCSDQVWKTQVPVCPLWAPAFSGGVCLLMWFVQGDHLEGGQHVQASPVLWRSVSQTFLGYNRGVDQEGPQLLSPPWLATLKATFVLNFLPVITQNKANTVLMFY